MSNTTTATATQLKILKRLSNSNNNNNTNHTNKQTSELKMPTQPAPPDKSLNQIDSNNNLLLLAPGSSTSSSSCSVNNNVVANSSSLNSQLPANSSSSSAGSVTSLSSESTSSSTNCNKLNKENLIISQVVTSQIATTSSSSNQHPHGKSIKYGELIVLGHNGCINPANSLNNKINCTSSRRKSKFVLKMRDKSNGVKPCSQHSCQTNQEVNNIVFKNENHSVTYTLSRHHTVVVQYTRDEKTDMFQIGRSTESAIDFIVLDTVVPNLSHINTQSSSSSSSTKLSKSSTSHMCESNANLQNAQSTISRFSCRILVDREYPYTARIYAAGFDSSKRIFLGEKATKWKNEKGELDGVTTNGVLIMHPKTGFSTDLSDAQNQPEWMEVSVGGAVFSLNESRLSPNFNLNNLKHDTSGLKSNILRDGTLIDLCGATLLWRSVESLKQTPTKHYLEMNLEHLNRSKPQCPVGFKTLIFPSSASPSIDQSLQPTSRFSNLLMSSNSKSSSKNVMERTPMVYLKCGHVHGHHNWGIKNDNERECPLCRKIGPYVQLLIGLEPSFYCDKLDNNNSSISNNSNLVDVFKPYAFLPCGHMASEATCKYWSKMLMPQGVTQGLWSICPFCSVPLCKEQPYVKLIFQEGL